MIMLLLPAMVAQGKSGTFTITPTTSSYYNRVQEFTYQKTLETTANLTLERGFNHAKARQSFIFSQQFFYFLFFAFYFTVTWALFGFNNVMFLISLGIYVFSIGLSLSPWGENLFRAINGIRLPMLGEEKRIQPIFQEVYNDAKMQTPTISGNVKLYIQDSMEVNAFAVGRTTVAVSKGAMHFMNDEDIRGIMAWKINKRKRH